MARVLVLWEIDNTSSLHQFALRYGSGNLHSGVGSIDVVTLYELGNEHLTLDTIRIALLYDSYAAILRTLRS
jgi:hypothetical protein